RDWYSIASARPWCPPRALAQRRSAQRRSWRAVHLAIQQAVDRRLITKPCHPEGGTTEGSATWAFGLECGSFASRAVEKAVCFSSEKNSSRLLALPAPGGRIRLERKEDFHLRWSPYSSTVR